VDLAAEQEAPEVAPYQILVLAAALQETTLLASNGQGPLVVLAHT
jgi:hypothetical protein